MRINFGPKLTDWEDIKEVIFKVVEQSDFENDGQAFEDAIRRIGVDRVNQALAQAGHDAIVEL